ncbi:hypothetical protein HGP16_06530 [Rhizobium sp. P40RR-XXII]|uniref:Uncharacterized protein n=2 Tax=Rhizobium/Agrobacterium group TaxID=227290 RepID=A0A329YAJ2_RHITR|nr:MULTISPECIES: hypothetical protein [Rhizobium]KAA1184800.1 hypothetical protein FP026_05370 [Rhizobium tropici]NLR84881.1 hypothetical protein [Rhizobium sp. P28RR-XV]NLS16212.1 hypothetical protein [Rhizobium sp. P40RR-XXII]RAX38025.1 hypothetical protein DQ393_25670 [Rhizobium tropici]
MKQESKLMALIRAGKRQEAFDMVERLKAVTQSLPTSIKVDRTGAVTYYKGNRRFVRNLQGGWELAPKKK